MAPSAAAHPPDTSNSATGGSTATSRASESLPSRRRRASANDRGAPARASGELNTTARGRGPPPSSPTKYRIDCLSSRARIDQSPS